MSIINHQSNLSKPFLSIPELNKNEQTLFKIPKKATIFEYYSVSDGYKKIFTNNDSLSGYGEQKIQDTENVSLYNLFINGVLQPSATYKIEDEKLILTTDDVPIKGSPIILQMILI
ncbi:DUF4183 domain-containing protein [Lysinibacillus sp. SGAir0095]|uniref:DUF4183 domain-containing protein n=1 Tax=Lysinibacillus sp. SGAir0095 TaxID=2070463 RepID=UPI0010CD01C5|nr:DUF4183 domain-containing protein [Lysinibacillus sp. SGAir0095]QCR34292.1 hypothetical protein C1N55_20175 [Lysinibacillus sp. SGAir0095]